MLPQAPERPRVSVCVPTLEGEAHLARLLPALARQRFEGGFELVAVDSDSRDRTRALLAAAGARVERIARADFGHGRTRNRLAELARGELCVFLSQDASPRDERFLSCLAAPFADPRVGAVAARVLPLESDDPLTRRTVLAGAHAGERAAALELLPGEAARLSPEERAQRFRFDDVAGAIRRALLLALPFPELGFGEDVAWAARALAAGARIVFAPDAVALHAHRYGPRGAYARWRVDAAFQREQLGRRVRSGPASVLRGLAHELRCDLAFLARERGPGRLRALARAPLLRGAQVLGQLAGSRGALGPPPEPAWELGERLRGRL